MNKPGLMKYASHRGPWDDEPVAVRVKFWADDLARALRDYHEAKQTGDTRLLNLARRERKTAEAKLAAIGAAKAQQVAA